MQQTSANIRWILGLAFAAYRAGNVPEAESLCKQVLQVAEKQFDALNLLGMIEARRGNFVAGVALIKEALLVNPNSVDALINLGRRESELGDNNSAAGTFEKVLTLDPQSALARNDLGNVLCKLNRPQDALAQYNAALGFSQSYVDAWINRANVLTGLGQFVDALESYDRALALRPTLADAHLSRGNVLLQMRRQEEALVAYERALAVDRNLVGAWLGRGQAFASFRRYDEAILAFGRALTLQPDLAEAELYRGDVYSRIWRYSEALAAYDRAVTLNPNSTQAAGARLFTKMRLCEWTNIEEEVTGFKLRLEDGKNFCAPFVLFGMPLSPADQFQYTERYTQGQPIYPPIWGGKIYSHDRIRVAYVSPDFYDHIVSELTVGLFEHHDRSRFEIVGISWGSEGDSDFCRRLRASFDKYVVAESKSDRDMADIIQQLEIDIVVDLYGFAGPGRLGCFARRPAPIQVNYLGYAGTMGTQCFDYVIADSTVIPKEHFDFYSEKVVWLPDTFMASDSARRIAKQTPTRRELGLPETGFVFCCFNRSWKIDRTIFEVWMRLLKAIDESVLWLKADHIMATNNLRLEAELNGVAPSRLIFAPPISDIADHLARHRQADLFLDTFHYNAHATASDALWSGLPVLTCTGPTFAGRVAASLLRAVGLPELVTESLSDYEALAIKIAGEPSLLATLKAKLARNRESFPLFDTARFTSNIEAAYTAMWDRYQRGEPPSNIALGPKLDAKNTERLDGKGMTLSD
jgi:protein O-GlcNAc transferase